MPGEQIAVRNVQSNRVVKAWVVAPGLIRHTEPIWPGSGTAAVRVPPFRPSQG